MRRTRFNAGASNCTIPSAGHFALALASHILSTTTNFNRMSRRAVIEEEFDDDTDLPLPNNTLPNLGTKGAILEALSDDDDEQGDSGPGSASGPATPSHTQFKGSHASPDMAFNEVKDITPYKKCVYCPATRTYQSS